MPLNIFKKKKEKDFAPHKLSCMGKVYKDYGQFSHPPSQPKSNYQEVDFLDNATLKCIGKHIIWGILGLVILTKDLLGGAVGSFFLGAGYHAPNFFPFFLLSGVLAASSGLVKGR